MGQSQMAHLHTFSTPCAIVGQLKKLDDHTTMCFFAGYKAATGFGTQKGKLLICCSWLGVCSKSMLGLLWIFAMVFCMCSVGMGAVGH